MGMDKIMNIAKLLGWVIGFALGGWIVYLLYKHFQPASDQQVVNAAGDEIQKRKQAGKIFTGNEFDYKSLAEKFYTIFNWKYKVNGATIADVQPLLMQIKTYGDYLEVVKAYGVRSHAVYGHEGGLDFGANDQPSESCKIFYNAYVKRLKENNK